MQIKRDGDVAIVSMVARVDASTADEVETALHNKIMEGVRTLILDFSGTDFMASAGIRMLLGIRKRLAKESGRMVICGVNPMIRNVLDVTGLLPVLDIRDSVEDALES